MKALDDSGRGYISIDGSISYGSCSLGAAQHPNVLL